MRMTNLSVNGRVIILAYAISLILAIVMTIYCIPDENQSLEEEMHVVL